jgi:hypothetical protein
MKNCDRDERGPVDLAGVRPREFDYILHKTYKCFPIFSVIKKPNSF